MKMLHPFPCRGAHLTPLLSLKEDNIPRETNKLDIVCPSP